MKAMSMFEQRSIKTHMVCCAWIAVYTHAKTALGWNAALAKSQVPNGVLNIFAAVRRLVAARTLILRQLKSFVTSTTGAIMPCCNWPILPTCAVQGCMLHAESQHGSTHAPAEAVIDCEIKLQCSTADE
jgi:hypothetical protein